jgi:ubiquitin carboxyl-terminal hydrolase 7
MNGFVDLQLNVKGMKNLYESFRDYVAVETLDGENKYQAEGYGLQDAKKGIIFQSFPPVLHLQLKRFEYDVQRDAMVKVSSTFIVSTIILNSQFADQRSARISL